ncbi:MAG: DUF2975 domain-containing protein [Lachnospiraceae bacterium]|nr:DUF2975 domain-containing protein [Lachnospiraceae bacterium]
MEQNKMIHTARILDKITKAFRIILSAASVLMMIIGGISTIAIALGGGSFLSSSLEISFGGLSVDLTESAVSSTFTYSMIISLGVLAGGIIAFIVCRIGFGAIRAILAPMTEGRPFESSCTKALKTLAWLTLIGGAAVQIASALLNVLMSRIIDVAALFAEDNVTGATLNATFSINFLVYAAILFLLSYVFRYGEILQQESDETL